MHIYMHVCVCMCTYGVYLNTWAHTHTHIYMGMYIYTHIYMCMDTHVCGYVSVFACIYKDICCKELAYPVVELARQVLNAQSRAGWKSWVQPDTESTDGICASSGKPYICSKKIFSS